MLRILGDMPGRILGDTEGSIRDNILKGVKPTLFKNLIKKALLHGQGFSVLGDGAN